jgi:hypothetical protein
MYIIVTFERSYRRSFSTVMGQCICTPRNTNIIKLTISDYRNKNGENEDNDCVQDESSDPESETEDDESEILADRCSVATTGYRVSKDKMEPEYYQIQKRLPNCCDEFKVIIDLDDGHLAIRTVPRDIHGAAACAWNPDNPCDFIKRMTIIIHEKLSLKCSTKLVLFV